MRVVTFDEGRAPKAGIVLDGHVIDARAAAAIAGLDNPAVADSARGLIGMGPPALKRLHTGAEAIAVDDRSPHQRPLKDLRLGPPIPDPDKIICVGLNYQEHAAEINIAQREMPTLFPKFRNSLIGNEAPIVLPHRSTQVDYEGELAIVIGTRCKDVPEADALACIAGYMPFNDVSARDLQMQTGQWTAGKALDTFAPCGPALVSSDEIDDAQSLGIVTRLNGEVVQQANTLEMIFPVRRIVACVSSLMTLEPGDIIATGTPAGVGFARNPPRFLQPGDVVEVEVAGVGKLQNTIVASERQ